uniref:Uncharacterized protein n=2 Tax=Nothobranchius TaxID=28779 RepID=A0A1A7ZND6_NOTFU
MEKQAKLHLMRVNNSQKSLNTSEDDEDLWFTEVDETTYGHLKLKTYNVTTGFELTQENLNTLQSKLDALTLKTVDGDNLWSAFKLEDEHQHVCVRAANERVSQKNLKLDQICETLDVDSFWTIMEDKTIHAHLKEEAYKVADLISRNLGL